MNRKETTEFLGNLLEKERFSGIGKYWAKEVSIDAGSINVKRVDYMQFEPAGICAISEIEKGIFICYEVKSCKADFNSGFGKNFIGEKNYFVMPMSLYKLWEIIKLVRYRTIFLHKCLGSGSRRKSDRTAILYLFVGICRIMIVEGKRELKKIFRVFMNWLIGEEDYFSDLKRNYSRYMDGYCSEKKMF